MPMIGGIGTRQPFLGCLRKIYITQPSQLSFGVTLNRYVSSQWSSRAPPSTIGRGFSSTSIASARRRVKTGDFFRDFALGGSDIDPEDYFRDETKVEEEPDFEEVIEEEVVSKDASEPAKETVAVDVTKQSNKLAKKPKQPKKPKQIKTTEDTKDTKDTKDIKVTKGIKGIKNTTDTKDTKDAKIAKTAKKVKDTKVTKEPKVKPKKEETEAQRLIREKTQRWRLLRELRKTALKPPKTLPVTARRLFYSDNCANDFAAAAKAFRALTPEQKQELETRAAQNRIKNDEIYKEWLLTMTPLQIKEANIARRKIAKLLGVYRSYPLHDERLVARPRDSWKFFLQEQAGIQAPGVSLVKVIAQISEKWKAMSPEEQERYERMGQEDFERYVKEYREVYGEEPPKTLGLKRKYSVKLRQLAKEEEKQGQE